MKAHRSKSFQNLFLDELWLLIRLSGNNSILIALVKRRNLKNEHLQENNFQIYPFS